MKNLKSALAFILTIFILCSNSFAAEYTSEIADYTEAFEDYSLLAAIGITEEAEYEDIDFEKEISRADFAEMIVKALNCIPDDASNIENIFSDVEFDNEKAPYIAEAYKRGLISGYGDGRFNPNDIIKENEAVKIVVCALGYEPIAEAKKGYYYGYNNIAQSLKLFPGASISSDKLVLKNACKLIYKMLITNTNEVTGISTGITYSPSGKPLLASEFGIYEVEGILNALNGANIYGIPNSSSTELEINRTKYHVENASEYIGLLGESVRAFVKEIKNERQKELVAVFRDGSKSVTIEADDIYDVTETSVSYENSDSRKNIKVNSDSKVVYNGVYKAAFSNYNRADLKNADGEIKIIDSDKDGKYDTIMVWDYKYYVADSYSKSKNTIYIKNDMKFEGKTYIELGKNEEPYMCFMEGVPTAVKDIRDGDIISVARSANQSGDKLTTIYISRETINLTIDELKNNDTVVYKETDEFDETLVTEKEIKLATGYETATVEKIQVGESGTFKLNHRGEILVREKPKGIPMLFSGGLIPSYIINTQVFNLGNTYLVYILPALVNVWNIVVIRTFFQGLPGEMLESAKIDGSGELRIFLQFVLPLSKPVIATVSLLMLLTKWNDWNTTLIYIRDSKLYHWIIGDLLGYNEHHKWFGEKTLATPDGRFAGDLLKFGIGQSEGRDRDGLTALLNSIASLDKNAISCGSTVTNISLDEQLIKNDEYFDKTVDMFETYFKNGGVHFQLTYVSKEVLLAAKKNPENYGNLRVRVTGFSDYFVRLADSIQDDIIERTVQNK